MKIKGIVSINGASIKSGTKVHRMVIEEVEIAIREIVQRTLKGRDIYGRKFVKYSKGYKQVKIRRTGSGVVNLRYTGQMLGSIDSQVVRRARSIAWSIYFSNKEAEQKAIWNSVRRPFFGVSRRTLKRIDQQAKRILRNDA